MTAAPDIFVMLSDGERKEIARSTEVADLVVQQPGLLEALVGALHHADAVIVSHAAHALLSVWKKAPDTLEAHTRALLAAYRQEQWEIKEQLAKILPFLALKKAERALFQRDLGDTLTTHRSAIARVCALQGMVDLATRYPDAHASAQQALQVSLQDPSKALQARARKLAHSFEQ